MDRDTQSFLIWASGPPKQSKLWHQEMIGEFKKKNPHISVLQISFLKHKIEHKAIHTSQIHGVYDDLISREKTMLCLPKAKE